jgi:hypothetical protein
MCSPPISASYFLVSFPPYVSTSSFIASTLHDSPHFGLNAPRQLICSSRPTSLKISLSKLISLTVRFPFKHQNPFTFGSNFYPAVCFFSFQPSPTPQYPRPKSIHRRQMPLLLANANFRPPFENQLRNP